MNLLPTVGDVILTGCLAFRKTGIAHDWLQHATAPDLLVPVCGGIHSTRDRIQTEPEQWSRRCKTCERAASRRGEGR